MAFRTQHRVPHLQDRRDRAPFAQRKPASTPRDASRPSRPPLFRRSRLVKNLCAHLFPVWASPQCALRGLRCFHRSAAAGRRPCRVRSDPERRLLRRRRLGLGRRHERRGERPAGGRLLRERRHPTDDDTSSRRGATPPHPQCIGRPLLRCRCPTTASPRIGTGGGLFGESVSISDPGTVTTLRSLHYDRGGMMTGDMSIGTLSVE